MKGTLRLVIGFMLVFGGVGGMEQNTEVAIPLDSLSIAFVGLLLMLWAVFDIKKESEYE